VFARAREKARQASCQSNLKQIGLAMLMYVQDNDERFMRHCGPANVCWARMIEPYAKNTQIIVCPSWQGSISYGFNMNALDQQPLAVLQKPAELIMVCDSRKLSPAGAKNAVAFINHAPNGGACGWSGCNSADACTSDVHNEGLNITFCDGHVKWMKKTALDGGFPLYFRNQ